MRTGAHPLGGAPALSFGSVGGPRATPRRPPPSTREPGTMLGRLLILLLSVLPKHGMSRAAGWLANLPVPRPLRPSVYRGYSRVFGAKPEEASSQ